MSKLPVIKGEVHRLHGYQDKDSHVRLRSENGRVTTVPVHENKDIPKGLLRKIIREDLEISLEDFSELYSRYKGK
jgi:hypothetical protein